MFGWVYHVCMHVCIVYLVMQQKYVVTLTMIIQSLDSVINIILNNIPHNDKHQIEI